MPSSNTIVAHSKLRNQPHQKNRHCNVESKNNNRRAEILPEKVSEWETTEATEGEKTLKSSTRRESS